MTPSPTTCAPHPPRRPRLRREDDGTVTAFTVILTTALLACAGLVLDGGLTLTARVRAVGLAEEAARAGAQELDLHAYRTTGTVTLRPADAIAAAQAYLHAAGATGTATAGPATVTVTVHLDQRTGLLALVGVRSLHVTGHATAVATSTLTGPWSPGHRP
jgi:Flp pilus assembly protein TadG